MRLTAISRAVGLPLARDLPGAAGRPPLLARGTTITERYAAAAAAQGVVAAWVEDELSAGIAPAELLPETIRAQLAAVVRDALSAARDASARSRRLPEATVRALAGAVEVILKRLPEAGAALAPYELAPPAEYLHRHPVDAAALGLLLARDQFSRNGWTEPGRGRRFDRLDERLSLLGLGLLLADFGKVAMPGPLLDKAGPLEPREWDVVRGHPQAGLALLPFGAVGAVVENVIRSHHERHDGSGYPRGTAGGDIHEFAAIAAVADTYTAMIAQRPYAAAAPAHVAFDAICAAGAGFHPEVVETFRRVVAPYPVGTEIALDDGCVGVVARVDRDRPQAPVVRLAGPDGAVERAIALG